MKKFMANIPLVVLVVLFLFLRLYHLPDSLNFGSDQGMTLLETYNVYQEKKLTLISVSGGSWTAQGRYIFFSSVPYYLLMPVLVFFHWQPMAASYYFIFLQLISFVIVYKVLKGVYKKSHLPLFFSLLFAFSPVTIEYSRFVWTSNLLIPISNLLLALSLLISKKKNKSILVFLLGFLSGFGFGIHYSFILTIILVLLWMIAGRKFSFKRILIFTIGFVIAFSPLIVFELRHNFYNLRTLFFILAQKEKSSANLFTFNDHYFISFAPFVIFLVAIFLVRLAKFSKLFAHFLIAIYLIYSVYKIMPVPEHGFRMVSGWNYKGVEKASKIILSENRQNYNIVDILTGDSRAMALRYLLTISGKPPLGVTEYPKASAIFIYSKVPVDQIFRGSMWEIDFFKPERVVKTWHLSNGVYLYLVEKKDVLK
jgi:hypothetical protein